MFRRIVRTICITAAVAGVAALPAQAASWNSSSSPLYADSSGVHAAAGYGTWGFGSARGSVNFYPTLKTFQTNYNGAYANAFHTTYNNGTSPLSDAPASTGRTQVTSFTQYVARAQLNTSKNQVSVLIQVGQDRSLGSDPTGNTSLGTFGY